MKWTTKHEIYLCREMLLIEPYQYKHGSKESGGAWQLIADEFNAVDRIKFTVTQEGVRDHMNLLVKKHNMKMRKEEASSGLSPQESELDGLVHSIIAKSKVASEALLKLSQDKQAEADKDRENALHMRKMAMETLSQTQKRKADDYSEAGPSKAKPEKKTRNTGSATIAYLREKGEKEMEQRKKEYELRKLELQHQQNIQQQLMQQQQQQNQMLLGLLEKVIGKN